MDRVHEGVHGPGPHAGVVHGEAVHVLHTSLADSVTAT